MLYIRVLYKHIHTHTHNSYNNHLTNCGLFVLDFTINNNVSDYSILDQISCVLKASVQCFIINMGLYPGASGRPTHM